MIERHHAETLVSMFAIIISAIALAISIWQLNDNREHNRLSVRPNLIITTLLQGGLDKKNGVYISNDGLGPGILTNFKVTANGHVFAGLGTSQWDAVLKAMGVDPACFARGWPMKGATVSVGEQTLFLALTSSKTKSIECFPMLIKLFQSKDLTINLEYESMYKEKFTYEANTQINEYIPIP